MFIATHNDNDRGVMTMHENSLVAYREEFANFNEREKLVYGEIAFNGPMTDRDVRNNLFGVMADANTVRPRITELIKKGWLEECGKVKDAATNKTVRKVQAITPEQKAGQQVQPSLF